MGIFVLEVISICLIEQYQNAIPRVMPLNELKKVQLQEHFKIMTHDSIFILSGGCTRIKILDAHPL